jgi:hypothetical protein
MHVLLAQSVPTASAVPCLRAPVGNWILTKFDARDGSSRIEFAYRYGDGDTATIDSAAACDPRDAREVASQFEGVRRYDRELVRAGLYADETYYQYPGGCTVLRFHLAREGASLRGADIAAALGFLARERLDRQIRRFSNGHLQLDPDGR